MRGVQHTWIRAFGSCTGAGAALTAGGVCAVLAVMGTMTFGLWASRSGPDGQTLALPRVPSAGPASGADVRTVRTAAVDEGRSVAARRAPTPRFETTATVTRRSARRSPTKPSPRATPASPGDEARPSIPAPRLASPAAATSVPQALPSAVSIPPAGLDAPPTVRRTTEAVLAPVERVADAAQGAVREVAGPTVAPHADAVVTPVRGAVREVAGGLLGVRAPAPSGAPAAP